MKQFFTQIAVGVAFAVAAAAPASAQGHSKGEISIEELQNLMAGGKELQVLDTQLGGTI